MQRGCLFRKGMGKGEGKAQHSHSNRSSVCRGSSGRRVVQRVCLLGFQSICQCNKIISLGINRRVLFSFSATYCSKAHAGPCVKVHAVYTLACPITQLSQTNLVFFHRLVGKMQNVERWGNSQEFLEKQWSVCCKSAQLLGKLNMLLFLNNLIIFTITSDLPTTDHSHAKEEFLI